MKLILVITALLLFAESIDLHQYFTIEKTELVKKIAEGDGEEEGEGETKVKIKEIDKYSQHNYSLYISSINSDKKLACCRSAAMRSSVFVSEIEQPPEA